MMKIVSKILMLVLLVFSFSLSIADMAYAVAQISLQNNSNLWLNLYIDGNFGCGPVMPRGFCTSSVKEGVHRLEARKGQKTVAHEEGVQIGDGTSPTWTPTIEDSAQDKTLLMVGKWRNEKGDVYSLTVTADKINIDGVKRIIVTRKDLALEGFIEWSDSSYKNCVIPGYRGPITGTIAENGTSIVLQYDWPNYQLRLNGNQCSGVSFLGKERVEFKLVKE
ncbi:MAG: hypothetical protein ABSD50_17140 [Smithella sp.]